MKLPWLAPLLLLAPACLENEEELDIAPDGSVEATLVASGDLADLEDGYPIPLEAPWRASSEDARSWARIAGGTEDRGAKKRLEVRAHFGSVEELPHTYAPAGETYRGAYLARDTSLSIEEGAGGRTYVFERTVHGHERDRLDPLRLVELPEDLEKRLEQHALTPRDRAQVIEILARGHASAAEALVRDALLGFFLSGRGELAAHEVPGVVAEVCKACAQLVDPGRIGRLLALVEAGEDKVAGEELETLEHEWRDTVRATLETALGRRGVPQELRNAAAFALEFNLAAVDHYEDLGDETFRLRVGLPGTIVGGNFARVEDGRAVFEFKGRRLQQGDVVLRAVSVLE